MSEHRRADADAEIAEYLRRNPELEVKDDGRNHAAPYRPIEVRDMHPTRNVPTEHDEQVALFAWAAANEAQHPELAMLHATPNGGYRPMTTAVALKAEGVRAGYPDISLDVARGRWHGLRIELKRANRRNHATPEQQDWLQRLRHYGYMAVVCYGADDAQQAIENYLQLEATHE